jgi:multiple sugar transport system substrate-binding protein
MSITRRQFLTGAAVAASASTFGLSACNGGNGSGSADGGAATVAFTWWGNDLRNKMTNDAINAFMKANPDITIKPQPGEWDSYWDKLATQVAGNTAPDMIQMDMAYINEYASRGALLNLADYGVDTSKFAEGTAEPGTIDGKLVGVNAGVNSLVLMANPDVFEKVGVELPDDMTWTWDDYKGLSAELTAKSGGEITGSASAFYTDNLLQIWLRQNGKDVYTADGLGFNADDLATFLNMMVDFSRSKAIPNASAINEEIGKSMDQTAFGQGKQGFALYWSNQLAAINEAAGTTMQMLRPPTVSGDAMQRNAWYKASMLWSASARTKEPEAVAKIINWWVNDPAAATICLDERGIPANPELVEAIKPKLTEDGKTVAKFIEDIAPELGENPVAPPPGGGELGDILTRHATDVMFGRAKVGDAANKIISELESAIGQ